MTMDRPESRRRSANTPSPSEPSGSLIQCAHQRSRRFEFFVDLFMFFQFRGRRKATFNFLESVSPSCPATPSFNVVSILLFQKNCVAG
jgi:hypothetical protein